MTVLISQVHGAAWYELAQLNQSLLTVSTHDDSLNPDLWKFVGELCYHIPKSQAITDCIHGIGHGFLQAAPHGHDQVRLSGPLGLLVYHPASTAHLISLCLESPLSSHPHSDATM